jgi:RimJ/RimL family protein N-acetyltransferase
MLEGKLVNLRALEKRDLKQLVDWMNDPELTQWLGPRFPISLEEQEIWYGKLIQDTTKKKLIIENKEGTAVGLISLMDLDWRNRQAELGIYLGGREHLTKGYAIDALSTFLQFTFQELGLNRIYIRTFEDNVRAIHLFAKSGFKQEGILRSAIFYGGRYRNIVLMSVLAAEIVETSAI